MNQAMLTVSEAAAQYRLGRNRVLQLVHDGELRSLRLGRRILIPRTEVLAYIDRNLAAAEDAQPILIGRTIGVNLNPWPMTPHPGLHWNNGWSMCMPDRPAMEIAK